MYKTTAIFKQFKSNSKGIRHLHEHTESCDFDVPALDSILWFGIHYLVNYIIKTIAEKDKFIPPYKIFIDLKSNSGLRKYSLQKTQRQDCFSFKIWEGQLITYTIVNEETKNPIEFNPSLYDLKPLVNYIEYSTFVRKKRKGLEILTPMGGAVKK